MRIKFYAVLFVCSLALSARTFSQLHNGTYYNSTLTEMPNTPIDSMMNGFIQILPSDYTSNSGKQYPLLVFFEGINQLGNGGSELSNLYGTQNVNQLPDIIMQGNLPGDVKGYNTFTVNGNPYNFIIIIPQVRPQIQATTKDWVPTPGEVNDVINYALQNYRVDVNRVYLGGLSLGGGAAVNYVGDNVAYGQRVAADMSFSAASNLWDNHSRVTNIANANVPMWFFEVTGDDPYDTLGKHYVDSLLNNPHTADAFLTMYPAGGHNSWEPALQYPATSLNSSYPNVWYWLLANTRSLSAPQFATIDAGANQVIGLANGSMVAGANDISFTGATAHLVGTASTTGPQISSIQWVRVNGTGGTITSPNSLVTDVTGLKPGDYTYQLRVTDVNGLTTVDNVYITVNKPSENKYYKVEAEAYSSVSGPQIQRTFLDEGFAYGLGYLGAGNSAAYNVSVATPGTYDLYYRYSTYGAQPIQIVVNGTTYSASLSAVNAPNWVTNKISVSLASSNVIDFISQGNNWQGFNYFELALTSSSSLPVHFVYFNAQCEGSSVNLQWKTAQEQNTKDFVVQRSSDATNWLEIGKTAAAGQSAQERAYAFVDKTAVPNSMYRIVETDATGQQTISVIVRSSCSSARNEITLYPNPSAGNSALSIRLEQATSITVYVLDVKGAEMMQRQIQLPQGSNIVPLNLTSYPNGVYTIALRMNGETRTLKLIKK